jgi:hypothetical protein
LPINLGEVEDQRFELSEPGGRVFKTPGTSLRLIKNVLDKVKRDLGNSPLTIKKGGKIFPPFQFFFAKIAPIPDLIYESRLTAGLKNPFVHESRKRDH